MTALCTTEGFVEGTVENSGSILFNMYYLSFIPVPFFPVKKNSLESLAKKEAWKDMGTISYYARS